jgi:hypothetical protein
VKRKKSVLRSPCSQTSAIGDPSRSFLSLILDRVNHGELAEACIFPHLIPLTLECQVLGTEFNQSREDQALVKALERKPFHVHPKVLENVIPLGNA